MQVKLRRNKRLWIVIIGALTLLIVAGLWWGLTQFNKSSIVSDGVKPDESANVIKEPEVIKVPTIHMAAMGDMLAHDTINANAKTNDNYDYAKYFANIRDAYNTSDVVFCNQEGLSSGETYGISGYPSFNAPNKFSADLQSGAGCNLINLANNHMGDKGTNAINATIDNWAALKPLGVSGANKSTETQDKVSYATVNGIKIGFVAFADFNNNRNTPAYAVNIYHDEALVRKLVSEARANAEVVIVSMHWGVEDSNYVSDGQLAQADLLNKLGVDVIIGTGPHVLQMMQTVYRRTDNFKTYVWYSLGNMLSSQLNINQLIGGIAQFDITKIDNKIEITNQTFTPTYMHYEWTAAESANSNLLARKNAMIYLLKDAADPLSRSLFNTTVQAQKQYVINTIGSEVKIVD